MANFKIVYAIEERAGKSYWNKVGVAFVNRDDSLSVRLSAIPAPTPSFDREGNLEGMTYNLQIREQNRDDRGGQRGGGRVGRQQQRQDYDPDLDDPNATDPFE
jgi:hypothetical protein